MKITSFIILILCCVLEKTSAQELFKPHDKKSIPASFTGPKIITSENEKGLLMSYKNFKRGKIAPASEGEINRLMTTMLLGSGTLIYNYLKSNCESLVIDVLEPNGFFSTSFVLTLECDGNHVLLMRSMDNRLLLGNAMAAEDPSNYSLLISFDYLDQKAESDIRQLLVSYLETNKLSYKEIN